MFRPAVEFIAASVRHPRAIGRPAMLAIALLAAPAAGLPAAATTASLTTVEIRSVELYTDAAIVTQTSPATGVTDQGHDSVDVVGLTVAGQDGADPVGLVPRVIPLDVVDVGYPSDLSGVAVSENGAQTPANTAGFDRAIDRAFTSLDLRDYVRSDELSQPGQDWGYDYDVQFQDPLTSDDYLLVQERNGNSRFRLTALDATGHPIATGTTVSAPYGWNTGYAPADETPAQPVHLSLVSVSALLDDDQATAHGFRIDNDDEADLKLTALIPLSSALGRASPSATDASATEDGATEDGATEDGVDGQGSPVAMTKTVYAGHDGGLRCGEARSFAEADQNDPVTYCFTVTNTGGTHLADLVIDDPLVAGTPMLVTAESTPLAPGHTARYYLETNPPPDDSDGFVDETFVNTATLTATLVDGSGSPVAGAVPVSTMAEAVVFPAEGDGAPIPQVALHASVYAGTDGGVGCPAAKSTVVERDAEVTYCFTVTNTGNTHLDSIGLADPLVAGSPILLRADSEPLAPGASAYYYLDGKAPAEVATGFATASVVTANSVDADGADLVGVGDVSSRDGALLASTPVPAATPTPSPAPAPVQTTPEVATPDPALQTDGATPAAEAVTELAYTGWETWFIATMGVGLLAVGWLLVNTDAAGRRAYVLAVKRSMSATAPATSKTSSGPSSDSGVA